MNIYELHQNDKKASIQVILRVYKVLAKIAVGIIVLFIAGGFAFNYLNDGSAGELHIEANQPIDAYHQIEAQHQVEVEAHTNQLLVLIEKVRLKEESAIEKERNYLIEIGADLNILLEEVDALEKQLNEYPKDGYAYEYNVLYIDYDLKWNEYNSMYEQYNKSVEEFNKTVETYNKKYKSTNQ